MSHPLISGLGAAPPFKSRLSLNPLPPGTCFENFEQLQKWIEEAQVTITAKQPGFLLGTAGTIESADRDDRDKLRAMFDDEGRFFGFAVFSVSAQNWSLAGVPGELRTIRRSELNVERDMEVKALNGWFLCDGSTVGVPDLRPKEQAVEVTVGSETGEGTFTPDNNGFFSGADPEDENQLWDIYTVMKLA
jgi:hypothetical protein